MRIIALIFLLVLPPTGDINQASQYFQQGNTLFQKGAYNDAIDAYEKALATGDESAELYFNLGNAYFKTDRLGKSILQYERANKLLPNDADIKYNLELAQLRVVDKLVIPPDFFLNKMWKNLKNIFGVDQWGIVAVILYFATIGLFIARLLWQKPILHTVSAFLLIPLLILTLIAGSFFFLRMGERSSERYAIILVSRISVLSAPAADATEVFALHEGTKVHLGERSGAYNRISLPDGKVGWLQREALEEI